MGARALATAVALTLAAGSSWAGTEIAQRPAQAAAPSPPAWCDGSDGSTDGAEPPRGRRTQARPMDAAPRPVMSWHALARGTLLHTQLDDDAQLVLRLHGGKLGLYLALRLPGR